MSDAAGTRIRVMRRRLYEILEQAREGDRVSRVTDIALMVLILLNVVMVVFETVDWLYVRASVFFTTFNLVSVAIFSVEYVLRLWVCVESDEVGRQHPFWGRVRYAFTPLALVDLVAILPFYLPLLGVDLRSARALRVLRILRLLKFARYSRGLRILLRVLQDRREELFAALGMLLALLVLSSSVVYYAERHAQPEAFSNIPETMWWAIATLTTVGYGDVYPITTLGRIFGAVVAVSGLLLLALPTGIVGAGFVEEFGRKRVAAQQALHHCPHCGEPLESGN